MLKLKNEYAENSIMQTITIAVSAILIAAGLVTAPGLINNARDNNARTDLANIAYAQEFYLSTTGHYYDVDNTTTFVSVEQELAYNVEHGDGLLTKPNAVNNLQYVVSNSGVGLSTSVEADSQGVSFSLSGDVTNHSIQTCSDKPYYLLRDQSASGKWFYRGSGSADVSADFSKIVNAIPAAVLAECPTLGDGFEGEPVDGTPGGDDGNENELPSDYITANSWDRPYLFTVHASSTDTPVDDLPWVQQLEYTPGDIWWPESTTVEDLEVFAGDSEVDYLTGDDFVFSYHSIEDDSYISFLDLIIFDAALDELDFNGDLANFLIDGWVTATVDGVPGNSIHITLDADDLASSGIIGNPNAGLNQANAVHSAYTRGGLPFGYLDEYEDFMVSNNFDSMNNDKFAYDAGQNARLGNMNLGTAEIISIVGDDGAVYSVDMSSGYAMFGKVGKTVENEVEFDFRIRLESNFSDYINGDVDYLTDYIPFGSSGFTLRDSSNNEVDIYEFEASYVQIRFPGASQPMWIAIHEINMWT